jgi:hypothetical protein
MTLSCRLVCFFLVALLAGCQSGYQAEKRRACESYKKYVGRDSSCDKDIAVGFVDTYRGMSCSDFKAGRIAFAGGYFWVSDSSWEEIRPAAIAECESQSGKKCMIIIENGECVLDRENAGLQNKKSVQSMPEKNQSDFSLDGARAQCSSLGYKENTEKFSECVNKLSR